MSKQTALLIAFVMVVTTINLNLWMGVVESGPASRSGRITGLILMLALAALFAEKFSTKPYVDTFVRASALIGMSVMMLVLMNV